MDEISKYITNFPEDIQEKMQKIRKIILDEVPEAVEKNRLRNAGILS